MKTHRSHDHHPPQRAPWLAGSGTAGPDRDPRRGVAAAAGHASRRGRAGELGTDAGGLSHQEAAARLEHAGPNRLPQARGPSLPRQFAAQLLHFFALLLWVAAVLAFVGQMPQLGWAIIAVVIVNAVFSFVQEYRAERATRALAALLPEEATALRDGRKRRGARDGGRSRTRVCARRRSRSRRSGATRSTPARSCD